jgi:VanZ family protein
MRQNEGVLTWRNSFKILLWSLFYGIVIEVFQGVFTHVRSADVLDVVANLAGSLVGVVFFQKIKHIFTV